MPIVLVFWRWYYGYAFKNILTAWRNYILFVLHYFSIPLLLRTLFAPWRRDITLKPHGFDFKKIFEYVAFNGISRGLGFLVRFCTIIFGIIFLVVVIISGAIFVLVWIFLPLITAGLLIFAISLLL